MMILINGKLPLLNDIKRLIRENYYKGGKRKGLLRQQDGFPFSFFRSLSG